MRIAPADATKKTAQDALRTTIDTGGDLQVDLISRSRMVNAVPASTMRDRFRDRKEGVDADVPVDAQNAPTGTWKTADSFPQAPTPIIVSEKKKGARRANHHHGATQPSTNPDQVQPHITAGHRTDG